MRTCSHEVDDTATRLLLGECVEDLTQGETHTQHVQPALVSLVAHALHTHLRVVVSGQLRGQRCELDEEVQTRRVEGTVVLSITGM